MLQEGGYFEDASGQHFDFDKATRSLSTTASLNRHLEGKTMAIGLIIAAAIGFAVGKDASKRGMNAAMWGIGVFLLLIVFLPLYFIMRKPLVDAHGAQGGYPMQPGGPQGAFPQQPGIPQGAFPQPQAQAAPGAMPQAQPAPGVFAPGTAVTVVGTDGQSYPGTVNEFQNGQYLCTFSNGSQNWFQAQSVSPSA